MNSPKNWWLAHCAFLQVQFRQKDSIEALQKKLTDSLSVETNYPSHILLLQNIAIEQFQEAVSSIQSYIARFSFLAPSSGAPTSPSLLAATLPTPTLSSSLPSPIPKTTPSHPRSPSPEHEPGKRARVFEAGTLLSQNSCTILSV
jgi:hypothetical protein